MDFEPGTLLDSPLVATIIRVTPLLFAGAVLLFGSLVVICVGTECRALRRSVRRDDDEAKAELNVHAHAGH